jgi:hypothetical protein
LGDLESWLPGSGSGGELRDGQIVSSGPARTLAEAREDPRVLIADPAHELRAFTLSLAASAGGARGQNHGSFVKSVLGAVEKFYAEVVQHIKPWAPGPPRARDEEATVPDQPATPGGPPASGPRVPVSAANGQARPAAPVAAAGEAPAGSGNQLDHLIPWCGGRIGLYDVLADPVPRNGAPVRPMPWSRRPALRSAGTSAGTNFRA